MNAKEEVNAQVKCVVWDTQEDATHERTVPSSDCKSPLEKEISVDRWQNTEIQIERQVRPLHDQEVETTQLVQNTGECYPEACTGDYKDFEPVVLEDVSGPCLNDSEGYSSMEGSRSSPKTSRAQSLSPCCMHCGRTQGDWTNGVVLTPLSASPVPVEEGNKWKAAPGPVVVQIVSKQEKNCPPDHDVPVTVQVVDCSDVDNETYTDCQADHDQLPTKKPFECKGMYDKSQSPVNNVSIREKKLDHGEEEKAPVPPARLRRRQSLLNKRQKLIDLLTSRSAKRGPQVKTIKKTIRRILKGSELTDGEEEEIVEEITEEVFGVPALAKGQQLEPKNGSVTRTVRQTKDGRHILTTTYVQNDKAAPHNGRQVFNAAFD